MKTTYTNKATSPLNHIWDSNFHILPEPCQQYILQFKRHEDRLDRLIGRLLIRSALIDKGFANDCLNHILLDENGRPYINKKVDFNISHSGDVIICAVAENCRVGIDIEKITPVNLPDYHKFLNQQQLHEIKAARDPYRIFFNLWTMQESLLKADGRGLTISTQNYCTKLNRCTIDNQHYYYQNLSITPDYACHLSSTTKIHNISISERTFS